ncbi:MAG TPA: type I glyceraldehyde-3-phosphate dehydrogenase [Desulfotomaculum sp.]|nr:MAG: Glyceraldehyde-3-phosphate dehydrogenase, type I [Desulfotomaculum sp. 46_80]KUK85012.1 MAG: Glyceraldehyde-3-phosphate dehydrogenase, type I [Desulfofundulus kuznetsovii]HBY04002.1 type I glyceraldehyde-3-phosphate dehydrogenase [Desulfotomaculum sp.]
MTIRFGINGFGRVGRCVFRVALMDPELEIVVVNSNGDAATLAHLLMYDSVHGRLANKVTASDGGFIIDDRKIAVVSEKDPNELPWGKQGVDIVIESTGKFNDGKAAGMHIKQGAKKVIITAPAKNEDITIVMGVNDDKYNPESHHVVSCGSCTTNCLAPIVKVLHRKYEILSGLMTTIHAYTNDQKLLDSRHKDLRRSRAAAMSIIPTTTGAAKAINLVLPELEGRLNGLSLRVPTPDVSVVDLVAQVNKPASIDDINFELKEASENELRGIIAFSDLPLVSCDFNGDPHSSIVDGPSTMVIGENLVKVVAWYDNEWGYANRVIDLAKYMAQKGL